MMVGMVKIVWVVMEMMTMSVIQEMNMRSEKLGRGTRNLVCFVVETDSCSAILFSSGQEISVSCHLTVNTVLVGAIMRSVGEAAEATR